MHTQTLESAENLTREQMEQVVFRAFHGADGWTPQGYMQFVKSRSDEMLSQMIEMIRATEEVNA